MAVSDVGIERAMPVGPDDLGMRADQVTREIAIGGLAGLIAGVMVFGIGGRLFMRIAAVIDPTAAGLTTSNGNRIGDITLGGTLGFVLAIGLIFGVVAGILWVIVGQWLPGRGALRALANGIAGAAITPFFVVRADERDFLLLAPTAAPIAMVVGLAAVGGIAVALADTWLRRRLPPVHSESERAAIAYRILTGIGLLFLPVVIGGYFTTDSETFQPPVEVGFALLVVGLATLGAWILRVRDGIERPPLALVAVGRGALLTAVVLGALKVGGEVSSILEASRAAA
jgi:hypothetical protein